MNIHSRHGRSVDNVDEMIILIWTHVNLISSHDSAVWKSPNQFTFFPECLSISGYDARIILICTTTHQNKTDENCNLKIPCHLFSPFSNPSAISRAHNRSCLLPNSHSSSS